MQDAAGAVGGDDADDTPTVMPSVVEQLNDLKLVLCGAGSDHEAADGVDCHERTYCLADDRQLWYAARRSGVYYSLDSALRASWII